MPLYILPSTTSLLDRVFIRVGIGAATVDSSSANEKPDYQTVDTVRFNGMGSKFSEISTHAHLLTKNFSLKK